MNADEAREVIERMDTKLRAAVGVKDGAHRASIIARTIELRAEVQSIFDDTAYWNARVRKPNEAPVDPDPDGLLGLLLQKLDAQIKAWTQ